MEEGGKREAPSDTSISASQELRPMRHVPLLLHAQLRIRVLLLPCHKGLSN